MWPLNRASGRVRHRPWRAETERSADVGDAGIRGERIDFRYLGRDAIGTEPAGIPEESFRSLLSLGVRCCWTCFKALGFPSTRTTARRPGRVKKDRLRCELLIH